MKSIMAFSAAALLLSQSALAGPPVRYRTAAVDGLTIAYREAGPADGPVLVLLHGRQTASHMFQALIPPLAEHYHVIAPDMPGFGQSSAPAPSEFAYNFDHLAEVTRAFLKDRGVDRFGLVMHDWGVSVGFRLAAAAPRSISLLVVQNGVICDDPKRERVWLDPYWETRDPAAEARLRNSYRLQTTIKYHQIGARDAANIAPDAWALDQYYLDLPGRKDIQAELMFQVGREHSHYGEWQAYLKRYRPPLIVLWGRDSPVYSEFHANCYKTADPAADIHFYNGGHFLFDEHAEDAAKRILALAPAK